MKTGMLVTLVLAGTSFTATPVVAQDVVTVPDVRFMSVPAAQAALRAVGFTGRVEEDHSSLCGSVIDDRIVELGQVCHQVPYPGQSFRRTATARFRVQREDPRHGRVGEFLEWHLMPKLVGMSEQEALAAMREAGFTVQEHIQVRYVTDLNCQPGRVCRTYPAGHTRSGLRSGKIIDVGR